MRALQNHIIFTFTMEQNVQQSDYAFSS